MLVCKLFKHLSGLKYDLKSQNTAITLKHFFSYLYLKKYLIYMMFDMNKSELTFKCLVVPAR